ncbi:TIGR03767 family metallophosphoesterase [Streptomyces populi]
MPRIRSVATVPALDRRTLLAAGGAVSLSAGIGLALRPQSPAHGAPVAQAPVADSVAHAGGGPAAAARTAPAALVPYTRGTTLSSVATPRSGSSGYRRLGTGPGWKRILRDELAAAKTGRADRRTTLAAFVQLTDMHLTDTQHPLRVEFLRAQNTSAWRPQETLTVAGAVSLVERINSLHGAPATGSPLHFVMTTGDNTDNNSKTELEWFLKVMSGGRVSPNSGDPRHYEGVQASGLKTYWQPDAALRDADKQIGFPRIQGFLDAAIRELRSPGLNLPWYSTVGNHDALPLGCYGSHGDSYLTGFAVGGKKLMSLSAAECVAIAKSLKTGTSPKGADMRDLLRAHTRQMRSVTPDEKRAPFTPTEYIKAHLDPAHTGPGPIGHGYSTANLAAGTQYYTFRISEDVIGISLDTTDPGGHYEGSIGTTQLRWLEKTLRENRDSYAVVFSHHTSKSMHNTHADPAHPAERRHGGDELVALLAGYSNVLAWVNGHTHKNEIVPHAAPGNRSFWEISTASHIDFPQLARIIELVDNKDGTLSLFTTLVESSAPHVTDFSDLTQTGLAALYREISFNTPGARTNLAGTSRDRNTELILKKG